MVNELKLRFLMITPSRLVLNAMFSRLSKSAVGWSWALNGLRLGTGVLLLPLVIRKLSTADLGMYYVFLSLAAVVPLVDFGFGPTIGRFVSYAMGGAPSLQTTGIPAMAANTGPNYYLLWELLLATRIIYRYLTFALFLILAVWGTYMVELRIQETSSPVLTRLAWAFTLLSATWDIYSNWWEIFLRNMDRVTVAARIAVLAMMLRLVIAGTLFLCGFGLLSLPVASLMGSLVQRQLARKLCLAFLSGKPKPSGAEPRKIVKLLWPASWKLGLQWISGYFTINANMAICLHVLGLPANARYGLSIQLLNIVTGMASVWLDVKWPVVGQFQARREIMSIRNLLKQRIWLQILTFLALSTLMLLCVPLLLKKFGNGKEVLPTVWFALQTFNSFLEMQCGVWGTIILMGNRFPFFWSAVTTNTLSFAVSLTLISWTHLGLGALVLGPLLAGCAFNYWYWPRYGARGLETNLHSLLLGRV